MFNPWAPDSKSFIYFTSYGLMHCPLGTHEDFGYTAGMDRWQLPGVTFATWSRQ